MGMGSKEGGRYVDETYSSRDKRLYKPGDKKAPGAIESGAKALKDPRRVIDKKIESQGG